MRTLSATLTAAQKRPDIRALVKIVLTLGAQSYTFTQTRIRKLTRIEEPYNQTATVILDNSDGVVTSIDFTGYKGIISWGMTTSAGDEYSACAPLWVVSSQLVSWQGGLALALSLAGIPNRLGEDKANIQFPLQSGDQSTVKDLITQILKGILPSWAASTVYALDDLVKPLNRNGYFYKCTTAGTSAASTPTWPTTIGNTVTDNTAVWTCQGRELTVYESCASWTPTFDSEDSLFDSVQPQESFAISLNESRLSAIKRLLSWTKCYFRAEGDEAIHIRQPVISGTTYDYEYSLASGEHTFFNKALRRRLVIPNGIRVRDNQNTISAAAKDTGSFSVLPVWEYHVLPVTTTSQADAIAAAILDKYQLNATGGSGKVPINLAQEVLDYVLITDARENDSRAGNVLYIEENFAANTWTMEIQFGRGPGSNPMAVDTPGIEEVTETTDERTSTLARIAAIYREIRYLRQTLAAIVSSLEYLWAAQDGDTRERLHVTSRLRIPVGADQFDNV